MTIIVKNIKRSPTGRESIRSVTYDTDSLLIGRDGTCDLQLPSLLVGLKHATLQKDDNGKAVVMCHGNKRVRVGQRLRSGRIANLKPGAEMGIGPYSVKVVSDPENPDALTITVEQPTAAKSSLTSADEDEIFSLSSALPGKRILSWAFFIAIFALCLILPIWTFGGAGEDVPPGQASAFHADAAWDSGPLSLMHSNLKHDCKACHTDAFKTVADKTCKDCHTTINDHATHDHLSSALPSREGFSAFLASVSETFGRDLDRCSSCHVEHNGARDLVPREQEICSDCHRDLKQRITDTHLENVSDFTSHHPQFKPLIITKPDFKSPTYTRVSLDDLPGGSSGLKFPHDMHLKSTGAVAQMASRLGERYSLADGVDCGDCHRPEAGGELFEPVNMQEDCAMCHSLVFEEDDGYQRTLRHGEPEDVTRTMRDFYLAKALANLRDAETNTSTRRRPGRAARIRDLNRRELAFKTADNQTLAKVQSIFSEGGACYDCHVVVAPGNPESLDYRISPVSLNDRFYELSPFNHRSHNIEGLACESCHAADTSSRSSDVLLPKIEVCRDCHVGQEAYREGKDISPNAFPTGCLTCHSYHIDDHTHLMDVTVK